jgi:hypothetical protein
MRVNSNMDRWMVKDTYRVKNSNTKELLKMA